MERISTVDIAKGAGWEERENRVMDVDTVSHGKVTEELFEHFLGIEAKLNRLYRQW